MLTAQSAAGGPSPSPSPHPQVGSPSPRPRTGSPSPAPGPARPAPRVLTVQDVLRLTLEGNPTLLGSLSRVRSARYSIDQAYVPMQPTANFSSNYQRQLAPTGPLRSTYLDSYRTSVVLEQLIYDFGKNRWGVLAARLAQKQIAQEYRTSIETLLQQAETACENLRLAQAGVDVAMERLDGRKGFLATSRSLFEAGQVAEFDVLQYQASVTQAEQGVASAENQRESARVGLLVRLGLPPETPVVLAPVPLAPAPPATMEEGMARALERRPELASLRWAVRSGEAQLRFVERQTAPTLTFDTQYQAFNDATFSLNHAWSAAFRFNVPIYDGGLSKAEQGQARETVEQARQGVEVARRVVTEDVARVWQDLTSLWVQRQITQRSVQEAQEALRISSLRYQEGVASSVELLNSQEAFIIARTTLALVEANYRISLVNWRRAISADLPVALPESLRVDWELAPQGGKP